MRVAASKYFAALYTGEHENRQTLDGIMFKMLSEENRKMLEEEFSVEEIKEWLFMCNVDKAAGLDGFNMKFLQKFWHVFKDEIVDPFRELHKSGKFMEAINTTFIPLIPKKDDANEFGDFRPISLVG